MSKGENTFIVNSIGTAVAMQRKVEELFDKEKYVQFSWKAGAKTSMPQKALIHIWFRTWMAAICKKKEEDVTKVEIESMKRSVKARYYNATGAAFLVETLSDPFSPSKKRVEYTSISDWTAGECHAVMEWMQDRAAEQGIILESMGEYQRLKHGQHQ